jgi:hypothetical protein
MNSVILYLIFKNKLIDNKKKKECREYKIENLYLHTTKKFIFVSVFLNVVASDFF